MREHAPVLLVDVGSASVGACIAELRESTPILSQVKRVALDNASGGNTAALGALARTALAESLKGIKVRPAAAHVVLAAPWYKATISVINFDSEKPSRISESTIERALRSYEERVRKESPPGRKTIEAAVTEAYVNGYPTKLSEPLHGSSLALDYYEAEADEPFLEALEEEVHRVFPGIPVSFHSFLFSAFTVLRALRDETGFALLDIGGEITDAAFVRRGGISFAGSFPSGERTFLRFVAGREGSLADAASRASLFAKNELSDVERDRFAARFASAALEWNSGYHSLLEQASLETAIPHTTFIVADTEAALWFERVLASADAPFPTHPVFLSRDFFKDSLLLGEGASYDAFLSIAAIHVLKIAK